MHQGLFLAEGIPHCDGDALKKVNNSVHQPIIVILGNYFSPLHSISHTGHAPHYRRKGIGPVRKKNGHDEKKTSIHRQTLTSLQYCQFTYLRASPSMAFDTEQKQGQCRPCFLPYGIAHGAPLQLFLIPFDTPHTHATPLPVHEMINRGVGVKNAPVPCIVLTTIRG